MRAIAPILLCLLSAGFAMPAAAAGLERFQVYGREYVRAADWARANRMTLVWTRASEEFWLTNRNTRLGFTVDSRRMSLNGVQAWLSVPVAARNGVAYLSPLDLRTMIQPVLSPARNRPGATVRTICLDAGHGGKDPGNQEGKNQEKRLALALTLEVGRQLKAAGFRVVHTRSADRFLELDERPAIANANRADLFLSLHFNATPTANREARGVEVYCLTPQSASSTNARGEGAGAPAAPGNRQDDKNVLLAYLLQRTLTRGLPAEDRGVHRARFAVLRLAAMPAVLIEGGFMTHPDEARKLQDPTYRRCMAELIVSGVQAYKRTVEPQIRR